MSEDTKEVTLVSDEEKMASVKAYLKEKAEKDIQACGEELNALLKKYNCTLQYVQQHINGQAVQSAFSLAKLPPAE